MATFELEHEIEHEPQWVGSFDTDVSHPLARFLSLNKYHQLDNHQSWWRFNLSNLPITIEESHATSSLARSSDALRLSNAEVQAREATRSTVGDGRRGVGLTSIGDVEVAVGSACGTLELAHSIDTRSSVTNLRACHSTSSTVVCMVQHNTTRTITRQTIRGQLSLSLCLSTLELRDTQSQARTNIISDASLASIDSLVVVAVLVGWIASADTNVVGARRNWNVVTRASNALTGRRARNWDVATVRGLRGGAS